MALAMQGGQSDNKIMMLGRWKSSAFLKYVRPQTMQWAGSTSREMATTPNFLDLGGIREQRFQTTQLKEEQESHPTSFNVKNGRGMEAVEPRQPKNWPGFLANTDQTPEEH